MNREPAAAAASPATPSLVDTFRGIDIGVLWLDSEGRIRHANDVVGAWLAQPPAALQGASLFEFAPDFPAGQWPALREEARFGAKPQRLALASAQGGRHMVEAHACTILDDNALVALLLVPIDDRVEAEAIDGLQREVLEAVALGRPLRSVLDLLCRRVEALAPSVVCSVLLIEENGTVTPAAGPSLPPAYIEALHGAPIGPRAGSCGTAAWRREAVEVTDIATDPLWADYVGLLGILGMAACWSSPIISTDGDVVATFALYYRKPGSAPPFHRRMVQACVPLCRVAIQHEANRAEIERLAFFDPLTGLPNRRLFTDRARQTLLMCARTSTPGALLLLDVDRFKTTNDALGHSAGDAVLREIGRRLQNEIGNGSTVARLGGDEFVALLPRCGPVEASHAAARLGEALAEPMRIAEMTMRVSVSIGISAFPSDGVEFEGLLKNAEMAMYEAKRAGRGTSRFFTRGMNDVIAHRMQMEGALRAALAARLLCLHYQPKIRLDGGGCSGAEALVRWTDPVLGPVRPDRFIALAEECGLINELDAWVLDTACAQLAQWRRQGVPVPAIAVNVSPLRFQQDDVPAHVRRLLAQHALPPSALVLEVTERVMLADDERTRRDLGILHEMGVGLSIDDFGTGYSSLGYLKRLPVSELKLDKSFVDDIEADTGGRALAAAVVDIGRALGLQVVAEGVETEGQRQVLAEAGCHAAQGYIYTPPLPAEALVRWLAESPLARAAQRTAWPGVQDDRSAA